QKTCTLAQGTPSRKGGFARSSYTGRGVLPPASATANRPSMLTACLARATNSSAPAWLSAAGFGKTSTMRNHSTGNGPSPGQQYDLRADTLGPTGAPKDHQ